MLIELYVRNQDNQYQVGRMICPVVPRIGETIYLCMSLKGGWQLDPNYRMSSDTARFKVDDVAYEGYNCEEIEKDMGAASLSEGSNTTIVHLFVQALNKDTQTYIDRIIKKDKSQH